MDAVTESWHPHDGVEGASQAGPQSSTLATAMDIPSLRQSTRMKRPTQKAEESKPAPQTIEREQDAGEQGEVYCICRKSDDGKPMIYCADCNDWFHIRCVGLTKKAANDLSVFVCPQCSARATSASHAQPSISQLDKAQIVPSKDQKKAQDTTVEKLRDPSPSPKRKCEEDDTSAKRSRAVSSPEKKNRDSIAQPQTASSTTTKKHSSPSQTPSSTSASTARKSSVSKAPLATGSDVVQKKRNDALRSHATDQFTSVFREMFLEASTSAEEADERAKKYAGAFEEALFEANGESGATKTAVRVAGKAYRDKLRSFLFNLKDKSNKTLRARIASDDIEAARLATMTSEELANDEIRKEVERRKRENLEQSILKRDNAVPLRKVTHKGEVDIEVDAPPPQQREQELFRQRPVRTEEPVHGPPGEKEAMGKARVSEKDGKQDASLQKSDGKEGKRLEGEERSLSASFDFGDVWIGGKGEEEAQEESKDEESLKEQTETNAEDGQDAKGGDETPGAADNFIDNFLGMPEGAEEKENHDVDPSTGQTNAKSANSDAYSKSSDTTAWRGTISMPDEGAFTGSVRQLSGRTLDASEWDALLCAPHMVIEGRLPSNVAKPYLLQSRIAQRTELVALAMESTWEPATVPDSLHSALKDQEASQKAFDRLLAYFHGRGRYGVLQCGPAARGRLVKDFYIVALPKGEPSPEWLSLLDVAQFGDGQRPASLDKDIFLLVAVLFKSATPLRSSETPSGKSPLQTATDSRASATPLPASMASALAPGSSTLQDLLKAVGAASPAGQSPAQGTSSTPMSQGIAPPSQQGMPSASQMQALSEMPKPQLDDLLTKNPSLVDNLLKALGNGRPTPNSLAQRPPPPGPPPPRPPAGAFDVHGADNSQPGQLADLRYGQSPPYGSVGYDNGYGSAQGPHQAPHAAYGPHAHAPYGSFPQYPPQHQGQQSHFGNRPPAGPSGRGGRGQYRGRQRGRF